MMRTTLEQAMEAIAAGELKRAKALALGVLDVVKDSELAGGTVLLLVVHLAVTLVKLARPGGVRAVMAETLVLKHQMMVSNRSRRRLPNLTTLHRFLLGLASLFIVRS
jgi:hypothetical protein